MKHKKPLFWLTSLILTTVFFSLTYACIGQDGAIPKFRSIPIDLSKEPTDEKGWTGVNPTLVILIDFPNCSGTYNEGNWHTILLSAPNSPRFSMRDYYHEVSYFFTNEGLDLAPAWETFGTQNNGVVGWYRMPFNHPFTLSGGDTFWHNRTGKMHDSVPSYAWGWHWGQQLALLALMKADQHVNYANFGSPYGQQGSPWVVRTRGLQIVIVVAGFEASYAGLQTFPTWRHFWSLPGMGYLTQDPAPDPYYQTYVGGTNYNGGYAKVGEKASNGLIIGQGLVAHEIGHGIGLPDLYDTDRSTNGWGNGIGEWCLMAGADWLGNPAGTKPGHFSAWAKIDRGWITPKLIWNKDSLACGIPPVEDSSIVFKINPYNQATNQQYFLIENRQKIGYDSLLPGAGLLICHIDEDMINANRSNNEINTRVGYTDNLHYGVDVECEDGFPLGNKDHLDDANNGNRGDSLDPWNGGKDFNWQSIPNTNFYYGTNSYVAVENIRESKSLITADFLYRLPHDVGVIAILSPTGEVKEDSSVIPRAIVKNFGSNSEDFSLLMKIGDWSNNQSVRLTPGQLDTISFATWVANPIGTLLVSCTTRLATDMRNDNDFCTTTVTVTRTPGAGWSKLFNVSNQPSGRKVKSGGGITVIEDKGEVVYLLLGNNTRDFLKYDPTSNSWVSLCSIPAGGNNKKVKKGAYIVDDEEKIYAFKGGNTNEFYKYDPSSNSWSQLNEPNFVKGMKGGFAVYVNYNGNYIYAGSGASNNEWKRYNITSGNWEQATPVSLPVEKAKIGSGLTYDGTSKIYFLAGGGRENSFYYLDLSADTPQWIKIESLPLIAQTRRKKVKEGGAIEFFAGRIYAVKGGGTKEFWCYEPSRGNWTYLGEVGNGAPEKGIKCGRALTATTSKIYCLIGNNTNEIWSIGPEKTFAQTLEPTVSSQKTIQREFTLGIQPNPTRGLTKIFYSPRNKEIATISLYNASGRIVYREKTNKGYFSLPKLPAGVYILRFVTKDERKEKKLIIME